MSTCRNVASWQFFKQGKSSFFCAKNETSLKQNELLNPVDLPRKKPGASRLPNPWISPGFELPDCRSICFLNHLARTNPTEPEVSTCVYCRLLVNVGEWLQFRWNPRGFEKSFSDHGQWIRFHVKWSVHVAFAVWVKSTAFPRFPKP